MDKKDVVYINNEILHSSKNNEIMPSAAIWMDLDIIILIKGSQREKDKYNMS